MVCFGVFVYLILGDVDKICTRPFSKGFDETGDVKVRINLTEPFYTVAFMDLHNRFASPLHGMILCRKVWSNNRYGATQEEP